MRARTAVLIALLSTVFSEAQPTGSHQKPAIPRTLVGAAWRTDHTFVATMIVKNNLLNEPIEFTPVVYMADGTEYDLPPQVAKPAELLRININDALHNAPAEIAAHLSTYGSAALHFTHPWNAISADLQSLDAKRSLIFVNCFVQAVPDKPAPPEAHQVFEALWWKRSGKAGAFIALANATTHSIDALVQPSRSSGTAAGLRPITIAPHATTMLDVGELLGGAQAAEDLHGGVRIEYDGSIGDLLPFGGSENADEGFSAPMYFREQTLQRAAEDRHIASVGIMVGTPDPHDAFSRWNNQSFVPLRCGAQQRDLRNRQH